MFIGFVCVWACDLNSAIQSDWETHSVWQKKGLNQDLSDYHRLKYRILMNCYDILVDIRVVFQNRL